MAFLEPLYLGFDLSTQQLKGLAVTSSLKVQYEAKFDFDDDSTGLVVKQGVMTDEEEHEVYAPVALWLQALDNLLRRLEDAGIDFDRVKGISGAGQQHGSVYWSEKGEYALRNLDKDKSLEEQLDHAFSHPFSPNWQDASTQKECDAFDEELGNAEQLALCTGSKAHHVSCWIYTDTRVMLIKSRSASLGLKSSVSKEGIKKHIRGPPVYLWCRLSLRQSFSVKLHLVIFPTSVA